jgi:hypothetical protein
VNYLKEMGSSEINSGRTLLPDWRLSASWCPWVNARALSGLTNHVESAWTHGLLQTYAAKVSVRSINGRPRIRVLRGLRSKIVVSACQPTASPVSLIEVVQQSRWASAFAGYRGDQCAEVPAASP